jgi:hypothetical protein
MSAYLLTAALLICTAPIFAQEQTFNAPDSDRNWEPQAPVQVVPSKSEDSAPRSDALRALHTQPGFVSSDLRPLDDRVCYTMRSYVVARDRKDSDSVHPFGYSTCQRASKYRLRTTQRQTDSTNR